MPYRRFVAPPQLEVIRASDDTNRAELIALPLVRTGMGDHVLTDAALVGAVGRAEAPEAAAPPAA